MQETREPRPYTKADLALSGLAQDSISQVMQMMVCFFAGQQQSIQADTAAPQHKMLIVPNQENSRI